MHLLGGVGRATYVFDLGPVDRWRLQDERVDEADEREEHDGRNDGPGVQRSDLEHDEQEPNSEPDQRPADGTEHRVTADGHHRTSRTDATMPGRACHSTNSPTAMITSAIQNGMVVTVLAGSPTSRNQALPRQAPPSPEICPDT